MAEGAPTADVAADLSCRFCSNNVEVITDEDSPGCGDIECVQCAARWDGKTGALMWSNVAPLAAAPEGAPTADVADELAAVSQELGLYDERTCPRCAHRIHSGCPDCQPAPTAREIPADEEGR